MKTNIYYILCSLLICFFISCNRENKNYKSKEEDKPQIKEKLNLSHEKNKNVDSTTSHIEVVKRTPPYGIGILRFNTPLILFKSRNNLLDTIQLISIEGDEGEYLGTQNYSLSSVIPFVKKSEYNSYAFVWKSGGVTNGYREIRLNNDGDLLWYASETNQNVNFIKWENYLKYARIIFPKDNNVLPIRNQPSENGSVVGEIKHSSNLMFFQDGLIYSVDSIFEDWIKIKPLKRNNSTTDLKQQNTTGWVQWYYNEKYTITEIDDLYMESY